MDNCGTETPYRSAVSATCRLRTSSACPIGEWASASIALFGTTVASVGGSSWDYPLLGLAGDLSNQFEVGVVVQHG